MGKSLAHDEFPPSDDPSWIDWGNEVLERLDTPKTAKQLKLWARKERVEIGRLMNTLAWLDMRGLVAVEKLGGVDALWKRSSPPAPAVPIRLSDRCPRCNGPWKAEPQRIACIACGHSVYPPPMPISEEDFY